MFKSRKDDERSGDLRSHNSVSDKWWHWHAAGFGHGDGSLINWVCDVSCAEEGIRFVSVKSPISYVVKDPWDRRTSRRGNL